MTKTFPRSPGAPERAAVALVGADEPRQEFRVVHGYRRAFLRAGRGPAVLLLHGIGDSSETWRDVIPLLARDHLVIAPDLLGHGRSDKPRADYSVAAFANGVRDLLGVLGIERATIVGHSLGGGVTMQFAYQFPHMVERIALVSTGGAGREVNAVLRALTLPNAAVPLTLLRLPTTRLAIRLGSQVLRRAGTATGHDAADFMRVFEALPDATSRAALVRTVRSVVDWRGQMVTMLDRAYLTRAIPTMIMWGRRDPVIPFSHAHVVHAALPHSRLEVFDEAGHFPHRSDPARFVALLQDFLRRTAPADHDPEYWRELLRNGRPDEYADARAALTEDALSSAAHRSAT